MESSHSCKVGEGESQASQPLALEALGQGSKKKQLQPQPKAKRSTDQPLRLIVNYVKGSPRAELSNSGSTKRT